MSVLVGVVLSCDADGCTERLEFPRLSSHFEARYRARKWCQWRNRPKVTDRLDWDDYCPAHGDLADGVRRA